MLSFGAEYFVFSLLYKNIKIKIHRSVLLSVVLYGCETLSLTLREERRFRVSANRVLRKTFWAEKDELTREWRKLHKEGAYTPAESSRVKSRESCRVKSLDAACSIFVSQNLVIGRDGCYLEEMDAEKLILLFKDHDAIYDASRCEHRNCVLH